MYFFFCRNVALNTYTVNILIKYYSTLTDIPALDDVASADDEGERLAPVAGRVELLPVLQRASVVRVHLVLGRGRASRLVAGLGDLIALLRQGRRHSSVDTT